MSVNGEHIEAGAPVSGLTSSERAAFLASGWVIEVADPKSEKAAEKAQAEKAVVNKAVPGGKRARKQ
jgi:hypothetical protein